MHWLEEIDKLSACSFGQMFDLAHSLEETRSHLHLAVHSPARSVSAKLHHGILHTIVCGVSSPWVEKERTSQN